MRVKTSQYETLSGQIHIHSVKAWSPETNYTRQKSLEQTAFGHEVKVVWFLTTPFLHSVRWFDHFGGITALLAGFLNAL